MTFVRRDMALEFQLGDDTFEGGQTTITLTGQRANAVINQAGSPLGLSNMEMTVYGINLDFIERFSTYRLLPLAIKNDSVTVLAGDAINGMRQVFQGTIISAVPNFNKSPDISFDIIARAGMIWQVQPAAPNSYEGSTDVATIVAELSKRMGFAFRDFGVKETLADPYLDGTLMSQLAKVIDASGIVCSISNGVISIWPNETGTDKPVVLLNKDTGLVGYPTFIRQGMVAVAEYMPDLERGDQVELESIIPNATGTWRVQSLQHELSTVEPDGKWFTQIQLTPPGFYVSAF